MDDFEARIEAFKTKLEARLAQAKSGAKVAKVEVLKRSKEQLARLEVLFEDGWETASTEFIETLHSWLEAEQSPPPKASAEAQGSAKSEDSAKAQDSAKAKDTKEQELSPEERKAELEAKRKAIEERLARAAKHAGGAITEVAEAARIHLSRLEGGLSKGLDSLTKSAASTIEKWRASKKKD